MVWFRRHEESEEALDLLQPSPRQRRTDASVDTERDSLMGRSVIDLAIVERRWDWIIWSDPGWSSDPCIGLGEQDVDTGCRDCDGADFRKGDCDGTTRYWYRCGGDVGWR